MRPGLGTLLADQFRFLAFRETSPAVREHRGSYLVMGLAFAWLAGIGRYWDHPRAEWWQYAGLGSVAYVFVLAAILGGTIAPLRPRNYSYGNVLTFVAMTSLPAILYAIPVERFLDEATASSANVWFLKAVAVWRVALWVAFLVRVAKLSVAATIVATLLPMALIVSALAALNLEHAVFEIMGGLRNSDRSPRDGAYAVVVVLSWFAYLSIIPLLLGYAVIAIRAWNRGPSLDPVTVRERVRENFFVDVRPSARHGTGLFAKRPFRTGELVYFVPQGRVLRGAEIPGLTPVQRNHLDRISDDLYEVIEPPGCNVNHSCEPNLEERERYGIALRDIAGGEEITLDYDRIACLEAPFPCRCGAAKCRGTVRGRV